MYNVLQSLELEEVIKMHNKSIPWPLLEQIFSLINWAAELYPSLNPDLSVSVHVSTVPSTGLHNTAVITTCCHSNSGHEEMLSTG